ncbi:putative Zn-dependent protease [Sphingomonas insulae]|uniref:PDZ domain-containing protein n=1 Tax=Sphingomonas insulae TaxID=424800 RepID=A0ABP3SWA4_9SPHN|nr:M48 family metallopeptidase [Sphingomonas insulae]NIJ29383.1 putative Zn-dependent protease [Sphingomonas insulae]
MSKLTIHLAIFAATSATPLIAATPPVGDGSVNAVQDTAATFDALRSVDARMAGIAYRLTTANVALCRDRAPTPGWAIHGIDQYDAGLRDQARRSFGFDAPIAVEAVVPGSPAEAAGVRANDGIVSVNGHALDGAPAAKGSSSAGRDAATDTIAALPADRPLDVVLRRNGQSLAVRIAASPGCRSAFEVLLGPGMEASADGRIVQIGVRFFERYSDDEVAVVIAHELSHNILHHARRLDAAGVKRGLLAEVGRNGRLFRLTEDQADLLGMHLLRNAGYDPQIAVRFWRDHGGDVDGGLFRSRTHPSSAARANAIEGEISRVPAGASRPFIPPLIADADQPLQ